MIFMINMKRSLFMKHFVDFPVAVSEAGDDITKCVADESVIIANHQSTADVPLLMCVIADDKKAYLGRQVYWIMDDLFRCTPFGWVSLIHGDFFIKQVMFASVWQC
jgi:lysophosphatidylglycerol acyltransferase 1